MREKKALFVKCLLFSSITGNFGFQPCSHGDFLGSILGTGIAREKLGDILVQVSCSLSEFDIGSIKMAILES